MAWRDEGVFLEPLDGSTPKPLPDASPDGCRWPLGTPVRFCDLPRRPGSSYCEGHHAHAWRPTPPRRTPARWPMSSTPN